MEKISTFMYLYDNINNYEDLINADEIFELDEEIAFMLENLDLLQQAPKKETTDRIIEFSKSI